MTDLNGLKLFKQVVSAGGFSACHRQTGISRATLSRGISALERELGARLIERSTRSFRLTEQGETLYQRCLDIFEQVDEALASVEVMQREPSGAVRIVLPPSLLNLYFADEILRYLQTYSRVRVHIEASNRPVDVHNENVDFVIRARSQLDYPLGYVPVLLARIPLVLVVHPQWQSELKLSLNETLQRVPAIAWSGAGGQCHWQLLDGDEQVVDVRLEPRLVVDDMATLRSAALSGLGMIMIPELYVAEDLAEGRLLRVELDLHPPISLVHAVHLGQRGMRPAVRHLLDWLKEKTAALR
ncbi:LysR substrate-binding domain-containing protein [Pseudomonas sp. 5P_3.1_Bac2]|uniref:LysR substrate-binding domain-containing protein n=1 Tax=Pseudomonas sp. 5P_3.1_Bac2 TaxID=2971617 RepID=UPI0021C93352|nr:LysR substrate-binding domain-containing protein [Pseudomonas sp. 5P_3.1_Bac2]MCU1717287.1 LysR substrate-binding domain-containing protein [Pseudomonas sp. 5P_3.1_Bac2]